MKLYGKAKCNNISIDVTECDVLLDNKDKYTLRCKDSNGIKVLIGPMDYDTLLKYIENIELFVPKEKDPLSENELGFNIKPFLEEFKPVVDNWLENDILPPYKELLCYKKKELFAMHVLLYGEPIMQYKNNSKMHYVNNIFKKLRGLNRAAGFSLSNKEENR